MLQGGYKAQFTHSPFQPHDASKYHDLRDELCKMSLDVVSSCEQDDTGTCSMEGTSVHIISPVSHPLGNTPALGLKSYATHSHISPCAWFIVLTENLLNSSTVFTGNQPLWRIIYEIPHWELLATTAMRVRLEASRGGQGMP